MEDALLLKMNHCLYQELRSVVCHLAGENLLKKNKLKKIEQSKKKCTGLINFETTCNSCHELSVIGWLNNQP